MASRKEAKEQARAARLEQEAQRAAAAARKQRLWIFGGVIALALVVVVAIVAIGGGSGSKKATVSNADSSSGGILTKSGASDPYEIGLQSGTNLSRIDLQVKASIGGIEQHGQTLGNPNVKVKILYFGDLQCSYCQVFTLFDMPGIVSALVRTGKASLVYHSIKTATSSATVFEQQQVAAYAAGLQNKAWDFIERFYRQQGVEDSGYSTLSYWTALAQQISGLDLSKWQSDRRTDPNLSAQLTTDNSLGSQYGVSGTPTLVVVGPKGSKVPTLSMPDPGGSVSSNEATSAANVASVTAAYNAVL